MKFYSRSKISGRCSLSLGLGLAIFASDVIGAQRVEGRLLFEKHCAYCHDARALAGKGREIVNDLRQVSGGMFPVGLLGAEEVAALSAYLDNL